MIYSMTGFARAEEIGKEYKISVEIKSVNHRYLDMNIKMPRKFNAFEGNIRSILKEYIQRGKVDVYITYEDYAKTTVSLHYNKQIAKEYLQYAGEMAEEFDIPMDLKVSQLIRFPEVIQTEEVSLGDEECLALVEKMLRNVCVAFLESRKAEGENLKKDIIEKLQLMEECATFITEKSPKLIEEYREKLYAKVADLISTVDETRLLTEVTLFADRTCIDEELVRLKSHIHAVRTELLTGGSVGRKLDFIAQEMNREANTMLSKSTDLEISDKAIILKTEIEKIREQIQNLE